MKKILSLLILIFVVTQLSAVFHKYDNIDLYQNPRDFVIDNNLVYLVDYKPSFSIRSLHSPGTPEVISSLELSDTPNILKFSDNYCYVVMHYQDIAIIDVHDCHNPAIISDISFNIVDIRAITIFDKMLFVALENELQIFDVNDPEDPNLISGCDLPVYGSSVKAIAKIDNFVLIGTYDGIYICDITDRLNPQLISLHIAPYISNIVVHDENIFFDYTDGLKIATITESGSINVSAHYEQYEFFYMDVNDQYLWGSIGSYSSAKIVILDIMDLQNIQLVGDYAPAEGKIILRDNTAYSLRTTPSFKAIDLIDISDPDNTNFIGSGEYPCNERDIAANDQVLAVCSGGGVKFLDIREPEEPELLLSHSFGYNMDLSASTVTVHNDIAITGYTGSYNDNSVLRIHDISDPDDVHLIGGCPINNFSSSSIHSIAIKDDYAYVGCTGYVQIFDISDPTDPFYLDNIDIAGFGLDLEIRDNLLFVATISALEIYDVSNPFIQEFLGSWQSDDRAEALNVSGDYAFVANDDKGIKIIDVSNPSYPQLVHTIFPHYNSKLYSKPLIKDDMLIVSDINWNEIFIYDISDPTSPENIISYPWNRTSYAICLADEFLVTANRAHGFSILQFPELTDISEQILPAEDLLLHNYPNPFNPSTTIEFSIEPTSASLQRDRQNLQNEQISIEIYNLKGQKIRILEYSDHVGVNATKSLSHSVIWNGTAENGKPVSSGVYFYKLKIGNTAVASNKMLLLK